MSRFVREMLKNQALVAAGARGIKPGPVPGSSKPKAVDPEALLHRDILGRALVFRINNDLGHDEAKKLICEKYPTMCGERWNRVVRRRIYTEVGHDLMCKLVGAVGIKATTVIALYDAAARDMGLELNARNLDRIDLRIVRDAQERRAGDGARQLEGAQA